MATDIARVDVVATPIFCGDRWMLVYNDHWGGFTIPMTKIRSAGVHLGTGGMRWERGVQAALRNVAECVRKTTQCPPGLLMDFPELRQSERDGQVKHYAFQVYGFGVDQPLAGPGVVAEWLTAEEVLEADRGPISSTARALVRALQEASLSRCGVFPPIMSEPPVRTSIASVAICSRKDNGKKEWLVRWNEKWQRYFLAGGHANERELPEQCMRRELREELQLEQPAHYESYVRKELSYDAWSTGSWQMTHYQITTFDVELAPSSNARFSSDPANRWLRAEEIQSERCHDDKLVSPSVRMILERLNELSP